MVSFGALSVNTKVFADQVGLVTAAILQVNNIM